MIGALGVLALVVALGLIALRHNDWLPKREYRSGTGWCVWRWTYTDTGYITRLHLVKTPWCALCLHWINKPDPEPYLHDHPVTFLSLILRGGYSELRARSEFDTVRVEHHRWFNWVRANRETRHTICHVEPKTLTLVLMGPKTQEWGFYKPTGFQHWKAYYTEKRAAVARNGGNGSNGVVIIHEEGTRT